MIIQVCSNRVFIFRILVNFMNPLPERILREKPCKYFSDSLKTKIEVEL